MSEKIVVSILKQSVEKIDRVRDTAGCVLQRLLTCDCPINIPHKEALLKLIQSQKYVIRFVAQIIYVSQNAV